MIGLTTLTYTLITPALTMIKMKLFKGKENIIFKLLKGFAYYMIFNLTRNFLDVVGRNKCKKTIKEQDAPETPSTEEPASTESTNTTPPSTS